MKPGSSALKASAFSSQVVLLDCFTFSWVLKDDLALKLVPRKNTFLWNDVALKYCPWIFHHSGLNLMTCLCWPRLPVLILPTWHRSSYDRLQDCSWKPSRKSELSVTAKAWEHGADTELQRRGCLIGRLVFTWSRGNLWLFGRILSLCFPGVKRKWPSWWEENVSTTVRLSRLLLCCWAEYWGWLWSGGSQ